MLACRSVSGWPVAQCQLSVWLACRSVSGWPVGQYCVGL